jgi:hypothetical protein
MIHPRGVEPLFAGYRPTALPLSHRWFSTRSSRTQIRTGKTWLTAKHDAVSLSWNLRDERGAKLVIISPPGHMAARFGFEPTSTVRTVETEGIEPTYTDFQSAALTTLATSPVGLASGGDVCVLRCIDVTARETHLRGPGDLSHITVGRDPYCRFQPRPTIELSTFAHVVPGRGVEPRSPDPESGVLPGRPSRSVLLPCVALYVALKTHVPCPSTSDGVVQAMLCAAPTASVWMRRRVAQKQKRPPGLPRRPAALMESLE